MPESTHQPEASGAETKAADAAKTPAGRITVERVQLGVRMEKRMAKVLKASAEYLDKSLGELLETIVLHSFEGSRAFNDKALQAIADLKKVYEMDYDINDISGFVEDANLWARFTERARRLVFFAQEEAARLGSPGRVGTEHLLLGLVRDGESVAARILEEKLGVSLDVIRDKIVKQVTRGQGNPGQDMQLTPRAKRVIDLAYEEACQLNNNYLGTEHLLLGLIREGDGLAARVLQKLGVELERARGEIRAMQAS